MSEVVLDQRDVKLGTVQGRLSGVWRTGVFCGGGTPYHNVMVLGCVEQNYHIVDKCLKVYCWIFVWSSVGF